MLQRNYNKHVEKWGAEWLRVGSTLTLKPDLDNANVGMISLLYVSCRLGFSRSFLFFDQNMAANWGHHLMSH